MREKWSESVSCQRDSWLSAGSSCENVQLDIEHINTKSIKQKDCDSDTVCELCSLCQEENWFHLHVSTSAGSHTCICTTAPSTEREQVQEQPITTEQHSVSPEVTALPADVKYETVEMNRGHLRALLLASSCITKDLSWLCKQIPSTTACLQSAWEETGHMMMTSCHLTAKPANTPSFWFNPSSDLTADRWLTSHFPQSRRRLSSPSPPKDSAGIDLYREKREGTAV